MERKVIMIDEEREILVLRRQIMIIGRRSGVGGRVQASMDKLNNLCGAVDLIELGLEEFLDSPASDVAFGGCAGQRF